MRKDYSSRPRVASNNALRGLKWTVVVLLILFTTFGIVKIAKSKNEVKGCLEMQKMEREYPLYQTSERDIEFCSELNIKIR